MKEALGVRFLAGAAVFFEADALTFGLLTVRGLAVELAFAATFFAGDFFAVAMLELSICLLLMYRFTPLTPVRRC